MNSKIATFFVSTLFAAALSNGLCAAPAAKTVVIKGFDTMKYDVNKIEASPGQKITVELKNGGTLPKEAMGHNWVLLKAGSDARAYAAGAVKAKGENFQPSALAGEVLAAIPVLGPGESGHITFTAPTAPGSYPYLCSFPAHFQSGMKGVLIVK